MLNFLIRQPVWAGRSGGHRRHGDLRILGTQSRDPRIQEPRLRSFCASKPVIVARMMLR